MNFPCCGRRVTTAYVRKMRRKLAALNRAPYPANAVERILTKCPNCHIIIAVRRKGKIIELPSFDPGTINLTPCCQSVNPDIVDVQYQLRRVTAIGEKLIAISFRCQNCGREIIISKLTRKRQIRLAFARF